MLTETTQCCEYWQKSSPWWRGEKCCSRKQSRLQSMASRDV